MFKRKEEPELTVTAEEIHKEFDNSAEELLKEIEEILSKQNGEDFEEISKLKELGFGSFPEQQKEIDELGTKKQEAEIAKEYSEYPQKFISESRVKKICEKYGLLYSKASNFIGDIPKKNRKEILDFKKPKKEHHVFEKFSILGGDYFRVSYKTYKLYKDSTHGPSISQLEDFYVVATPDQFDLNDKVISDYRIIGKDPIVLYPVGGGYLIVSKWGSEADYA